MEEEHFKHNTKHSNSTGDTLYHIDVEMPSNIMDMARTFIKNLKVANVKITNHLLQNINNNTDGESHEYTMDDIYGAILKAKNTVDKLNIFEIGTKKVKRDDKIFLSLSKVCFRVLLEPGLDIVIVLGREGDKIFAKTAYLNKTDDNHKVGFNPERYYPYTIEGVKVKNYVKKVKVLVKKKESLEDLFTWIYRKTHL